MTRSSENSVHDGLSRRALLRLAGTAGVAAAATPFLAACAPAAQTNARVVAPAGVTRVLWGRPVDAVKLDPQNATSDGHVFNAVFDTLTFVADDGSFAKDFGLATDWRALNDKTWQFKLRQGVKWHNGDPFTAADVKFSIERGIDPKKKTLSAGTFGPIASVEVVDDFTVNVLTKSLDPLLPRRLSERYAGPILPRKYLTAVGDEAFEANMIGTGPYKFKRWSRDSVLAVDANKDYWNGAPAVEGIDWRVMPEETARITALTNTHEINFADAIDPDRIADVQNNAATKVVSYENPGITQLQINLRKPPLGNKLVRQALARAINGELIIKTLLNGQASLLNGFIPKGDFAYDEKLPAHPFDPAKARDLLKQSGYSGELITMQATRGATTIPNESGIAEAIVQMWKDVGFNARVSIFEYTVRAQVRAAGTFDGLLFATTTSGNSRDPDQVMWRSLGQRDLYGWEGEGFKEFLRLGNGTYTFDENVRRQNFQKMNAIALDEVPAIPLFQLRQSYGMARYVEASPASNTANMRKEAIRFTR